MNLSLVGAGNLATQLGIALKKAGHDILQVYSRTEFSAATLARLLDAEPVTVPENLRPDADCYFVALSDEAVPGLLPRFRFGKGLVAHTAGSLPLSVLDGVSPLIGVFYPLQTFSKIRPADFGKITVFIESDQPESLEMLRKLALQLGSEVVEADSRQRLSLHVAAVFACNFVNHFYGIADDLLRENNLGIGYLLPLIRETADKIEALTPAQAQTGPAVRGDLQVQNKHLDSLECHPEWQHLYRLLSEGIRNRNFPPEQTK